MNDFTRDLISHAWSRKMPSSSAGQFSRIVDFASAFEKRQRATSLEVTLSPLVLTPTNEEQGLITRAEYPHAIDLLFFWFSNPSMATKGEARYDSQVDRIGEMCGRTHLKMTIGSVEVYYNIDSPPKHVEIEAVFWIDSGRAEGAPSFAERVQRAKRIETR
jgi:hypothetical protein